MGHRLLRFLIDSVGGTHMEKNSYSHISVSPNYFQPGNFNKGTAILKAYGLNTLFHMFHTHVIGSEGTDYAYSVKCSVSIFEDILISKVFI